VIFKVRCKKKKLTIQHHLLPPKKKTKKSFASLPNTNSFSGHFHHNTINCTWNTLMMGTLAEIPSAHSTNTLYTPRTFTQGRLASRQIRRPNFWNHWPQSRPRYWARHLSDQHRCYSTTQTLIWYGNPADPQAVLPFPDPPKLQSLTIAQLSFPSRWIGYAKCRVLCSVRDTKKPHTNI